MVLPAGPGLVTRQVAGGRCLLTPCLPSARLHRPATSSALPRTAPGMGSFLAHRRAASQRVHYQEDDKQPQHKHHSEAAEQAAWDRAEAVEAELVPADASASTSASAAATADGYNYSPAFVRRRLMVFAGLVVGYTTFYLTRGSLTYSAPMLVADPALGLNLSAIGTMTSIFPMAYGVSKFIAGVMGAQFSARLMLGVGLMATATVNIAFGFSSSLTVFCLLWGLNGMLQGVGAPTCATILTRWFASKERGTYWGMWNIAHNLGGFLAPVIVGGCAKAFGWRAGMWVPGAIGLTVALLVLGVVRDRPQDCGFPPVDNGMAAAPKKAEAEKATTTTAAAAAADKASMLDVMRDVLKMPQIWALAFTYFCIYVVRQGVTSWLVFYLMAEKGATDAAQAALTVSGLELGGLAGSIVAGAMSDSFIKNASPTSGHVGKRVQVIMAYTAAMAGMLLALKAVPAGASVLQWLAIAGLGFTIYGPQMLIGLTGAELVSPSAVGASQGILGWIAYLGAANAGIPLSHIVQTAGWNGFFTALLGACGVALLLLSTVATASSYNQRKAREAALA